MEFITSRQNPLAVQIRKLNTSRAARREAGLFFAEGPKLLEEAVLLEQGQPLPTRTECAANLSVAASIPDKYVPSPEQRMDLYRRIAAIRSEEEADELVDELIDRYGAAPRPVNNLLSVALLRAAAAQCRINDLAQEGGPADFYPGRVPAGALLRPVRPGEIQQAPAPYARGRPPRFSLRLGQGGGPPPGRPPGGGRLRPGAGRGSSPRRAAFLLYSPLSTVHSCGMIGAVHDLLMEERKHFL